MRMTGPRNRLARRVGSDLGLKTLGTKSHGSLLKKINIPPGQHGLKGKRKVSERGRQLTEKQKLRYTFALAEKQLKNYFKEAVSKKQNTALVLCRYLEHRLDNMVYRLGFSPTRAGARQLVSHGHVTINGKSIDIPSYHVEVNDVITIAGPRTLAMPVVKAMLEKKDVIFPVWLERKGHVGKVVGEASAELIEKQVNLRQVIEYYSR